MRYIGGHVSIAGGLSNAIENSLKIGGNCLQIFAGSPRLWFRKPFADKEVNDFLSLQQKHQIGPVFIHALYLVNLASSNQELFEKSINSLVVDIQNGSRINSGGVIIHIGSHLGNGFDSVKDQLVASIERILDETVDCPIVLENDAGQNGKIGSLEELSWLIGKINDSRLKICLDTCHLFASGLDIRTEEKVTNIVEKLKELNILDKVVCIHLNDCASDFDSHRDLHANLGEGKIGLSGLGAFVNNSHLKHLPLILEVPGENKQGPNLQNILVAKGLVSL